MWLKPKNPSTPLRHGSNMKKHMLQWKKLLCKEIFAQVEVIRAFMKMKENEENMYKTEAAIHKCST